jgi:hypothetical protein
VGEGGLKMTSATIKDIDRCGKKTYRQTSDGVKSTFRLTGHAAKDGGKDIAGRLRKGAKVAVYYTRDVGKETARFFEKGKELMDRFLNDSLHVERPDDQQHLPQ